MVKMSNSLAFPNLKRVKQETSFYCGPASLQMLLSFHNFPVSQRQIVAAAGISQRIKDHGATLDDLARACAKITPDFQFWYKKYASLSDLSRLTNEHKCPVGIEWQGVFDYEDDEEQSETDDDDPGHYSVVTQLDTYTNLVMIADPDKHYAGKDRRFTILEFERRWWDINEIENPVTHKVYEVDDFHAMFIVIPKGLSFPENLGMIRG